MVVHPTKPNGIVIDVRTAHMLFISEEKEGPILGGDDIILSPANMPVERLSEE